MSTPGFYAGFFADDLLGSSVERPQQPIIELNA
jgi:hypothetical protein